MRQAIMVAILCIFASAVLRANTPHDQKRTLQPSILAPSPPDERGTAKQPLVIDVLPATSAVPTPAEARYQTYEQEQRPLNETWTAKATIALAVVTGVLALFTALMWWYTRQLAIGAVNAAEAQHAQTESSLRIAEEANKLTRDLLVAQHRPWVSILINPTSPLSFTDDGWHITLDYTLQNLGNSPAARASFTATLMPWVIDAWPIESLKGRSITEMPTLGTNAVTELRSLADQAKMSVESQSGFGNTIFPGREMRGGFGIYGNSPLFDKAKELEPYTGQFVLLVCAAYGFTLDKSAHVTAQAYLLFKKSGRIDLNGETLGPGAMGMTPFPDIKTDYAT